jgi:secreted PhoX family phosphatase
VDAAGNVYVADTASQTVRQITPDGVVTTLAGLALNGGSADGTGSAARFNGPWSVAVDSVGNVYVAEDGNSTIRKIARGGTVTTLAGLALNYGSADGTGSAARFRGPYGVAVDSAGNIYVAEDGNSTIRKITPDGVVTTLGGLAGSSGSDDGTGSAARFNALWGVAVDSAGNVYVADAKNNAIRVGGVTPLALSIAPDGSGGFFMRVQGKANLSYQLQRTPTMNGQWTTNAMQTAPASGVVEFHDTSPLLDRAFYRAVRE